MSISVFLTELENATQYLHIKRLYSNLQIKYFQWQCRGPLSKLCLFTVLPKCQSKVGNQSNTNAISSEKKTNVGIKFLMWNCTRPIIFFDIESCLSSSFGLKINKLSISLPRLLLAFVNAIKLFVLATFFKCTHSFGTFTRHLIIRNHHSKYCCVWCHANWVFNPKSTPSEINKHLRLKDFEKIPISPLPCLLSTRECF